MLHIYSFSHFLSYTQNPRTKTALRCLHWLIDKWSQKNTAISANHQRVCRNKKKQECHRWELWKLALCNGNSASLMIDLSNVLHCFWQSCAVANHTIASGEHAHILKATDWTSASQPTLKTDDSYLAFSNYDFKLIERNDKHILVGVAELMGILLQRELLELVYENNTRVISIFFTICLSCTNIYCSYVLRETQQRVRDT